MSLMSDQAKQSFHKSSGKIHCQHCGYEGPSKIERRSPAHYIASAILVIVGLFVFWPLMVIGGVWFIGAAVAGNREVCMQCNSEDHLDLEYHRTRT